MAGLTTMRKLLGLYIAALLPKNKINTYQLSFLPGTSPTDGLHTMERVRELALEWQSPVWIAKLDLHKAFDTVKRTTVLASLKMKHTPAH
eukprot:1788421-Prorocentrum_lima.AAC.1